MEITKLNPERRNEVHSLRLKTLEREYKELLLAAEQLVYELSFKNTLLGATVEAIEVVKELSHNRRPK